MRSISTLICSFVLTLLYATNSFAQEVYTYDELQTIVNNRDFKVMIIVRNNGSMQLAACDKCTSKPALPPIKVSDDVYRLQSVGHWRVGAASCDYITLPSGKIYKIGDTCPN